MASDSLIGFCEIKRKPDSNKKSKVLYKNGLRFPYRLFRIKRKPKSKPKSAKYFTKTASDSLIGAVGFCRRALGATSAIFAAPGPSKETTLL